MCTVFTDSAFSFSYKQEHAAHTAEFTLWVLLSILLFLT